MKSVTFVIPGDPESRTGGYIYDRRIMAGLEGLGWRVRLCRLGEGFPFPDEAARREAAARLAALPAGQRVVADGLAAGVLPREMAALTARCPYLALVHHPLAQETGLDEEQRRGLLKSETESLASARRVIVPGPATARSLVSDYGVPQERIGIVLPGTDPVAPSEDRAPAPGREVRLLTVASLSPRKGQILLVEALRQLTDCDWSLTCVGSLQRDPAYAGQVMRAIEAAGLSARIRLVGEVSPDALAAFYRTADVFVLPSYLEGYGMVLADALAQGLPIVSTRGGAIPDTVPETCGLLVPPGDVGALTQALRRMLEIPAERTTFATAARAAARGLPDWPQSVAAFAAELERVRT